MTETLILNITEIDRLIEKIIPSFLEKKLLLLYGDLGTGKTTLTQILGKKLGITEDITSPTFNLLNIYNSKYGELYHYDLYRLNHAEEIYNLGLDEAIEKYYTVIEWPTIIKDLLPAQKITINIDNYNNQQRRYIIDGL